MKCIDLLYNAHHTWKHIDKTALISDVDMGRGRKRGQSMGDARSQAYERIRSLLDPGLTEKTDL